MNGRLSTGRQAHDEAQGVPARITFTNTFSYKHEKTNSKLNSKPKMEAERRSTMSSLKGQLSNVEGSVKSMKVAVVVGSVLTVACLAAVFGVTVLANEVSKEVKVSNGVLATKAGSSVMTTSFFSTDRLSLATETVTVAVDGNTFNLKVRTAVADATTTTLIVDGAVVSVANGAATLTLQEGSLLASVADSAADRQMNWWAKVAAAIAGVEGGEVLNAISDCAERIAASAINMVSPGRNALPACGNAPASGYYTPIE